MRYFCTALILFLSTCLLCAQEKNFDLPLPEKPTEFQKAWLELDPGCGKNINREIREIDNLQQLWQTVTLYKTQTYDTRYQKPDYAELNRFVSWMIMYHGEKAQNHIQQWITEFDNCQLARTDFNKKIYCKQLVLLFQKFPINTNWTPALFHETMEQRLWREKNFPAGRPGVGDLASFPKLKEKLPSKELMELFKCLDANPQWNGGKNPERAPLVRYVRSFLLALAFRETDVPEDKINAFLDTHKEFFNKYDLYGRLFVQIEPSLRQNDFKAALNILGKEEIPQRQKYGSGFPFFGSYNSAMEYLQRFDSAKPVPVLEWDMRCAEFNALLTDTISNNESIFSLIRREIDIRGERYLMTKDPDLFHSSLPALRKMLLGEYGESYHKKLNAFFELEKVNGFLSEQGARLSYDAYSLEPAKAPPAKTHPHRIPEFPGKISAPEKIFDLPTALNETNIANHFSGSWRLPPVSISQSGDYIFFRNVNELICFYKGNLLWRVQELQISTNGSTLHLRHEPVQICGDLVVMRRFISSSYYSANFGLQAYDLKTGREAWSFSVPGGNVVEFSVEDDGIIVLLVGRNLAQQSVLNFDALGGGNNATQIALVRLDKKKGTTITARILSELNTQHRVSGSNNFLPGMLICDSMTYIDTNHGMIIAFDRSKWETSWMRRYASLGQQQFLERINLVRRTSYVYHNSTFSLAQTHNSGSAWHPLMQTHVNDVIDCGKDWFIHAPYNTSVMTKIEKKTGALLGEIERQKGVVLGDEQAIFVVGLDHRVTVYDPATMTETARGKIADLGMVLKERSGNGKLAIYENGKIVLRDRNWKIASEIVLPDGYAPLYGGAEQALFLYRDADFDFGIYQATKTLNPEKKETLQESDDPVIQNMTNMKHVIATHMMRNVTPPKEEDFRLAKELFPVCPRIYPHMLHGYYDNVKTYTENGELVRAFRLGSSRGFIMKDGSVLLMPGNVRRIWATEDYLFQVMQNEVRMYSRKDGSIVTVSGKFLNRHEGAGSSSSRENFNVARNSFVYNNELFTEVTGGNGASYSASYSAIGANGRREILPVKDRNGKRLPIMNLPMILTHYGWIYQRVKNSNPIFELYDYSAFEMLKVVTKTVPPYLDGLLNMLKAEAAARKQSGAPKSVLPQFDPADKQKWLWPVANTENPRYVFFAKQRFELYAPHNKFLVWDTKTGKQQIFTLPEGYPKSFVRNHNRVTLQPVFFDDKYMFLNVFYDLTQVYNSNSKQVYFLYDMETGKEVVPGFKSIVLPQRIGNCFYGIVTNYNGKIDKNTKVQLKVICLDLQQKKMIELSGGNSFEQAGNLFRNSWEIKHFRYQNKLYFMQASSYYDSQNGVLWEINSDDKSVKVSEVPGIPVYFITKDKFVLSSGSTLGVSRSSIYPLSTYLKMLDVKVHNIKVDADFQKTFMADGYPDEWDEKGWKIYGKNAWQMKMLSESSAALIVRIDDPVLTDYFFREPDQMEKCGVTTGSLRGSYTMPRAQARNHYVDPISGTIYFEFLVPISRSRVIRYGNSNEQTNPAVNFTFDFFPIPTLPLWGLFGDGCSILLAPRVRVVK